MTLTFHSAAEDEFANAALYYSERKEDLDRRFIESVTAGLEAILEDPARWRISERGVRRYLVHNFPYFICYLIKPSGV